MKFSYKFARFPLIFLLSISAAHSQDEGWTLAEAVHQARQASPDALAAAARVEAVRTADERVRSGRWPGVSVEGRYLQTTEPMTAFGAILNQGTFDQQMDFNAPGQIDAFTASLQARYALYTGGRQRAAETAASAQTQSATDALEGHLQELEMEVVRTWFGIRKAQAQVEALKAAIHSLDEHIRVSEERESAGDLHQTERLNLQTERARRQQQLLAHEHSVLLGRRQLAFLLGIPVDEPLPMAAEDSPIASQNPTAATLATHPRLRAMEAQLEAADAFVEVARGGNRPVVETFARYQFDKGWRRNGNGDSWTAGIAVQVPVFDGFAARADRREALAHRQAQREMLRRTETELRLSLANERSRLELAQAEVSVAQERIQQARASAELSRARYAAGSLTSTALIDVEAQMVAAEVEWNRARFDEQLAHAALLHAAGIPLFQD